MSIERDRYLVTARKDEELRELVKKRQIALGATMDLARQIFGSERAVKDVRIYYGDRLSGFSKKPPGDHWRYNNKRGNYVPHRGTAKGKEVAKQIKALPEIPDNWGFDEVFKFGRLFYGNHMYHLSFDMLGINWDKKTQEVLPGGVFIVGVPRPSDKKGEKPKGLGRKLRHSEYLKLLAEDEECKEKRAKAAKAKKAKMKAARKKAKKVAKKKTVKKKDARTVRQKALKR